MANRQIPVRRLVSHVEVNARLANDPEATKQAFQAVFRPSPQTAPKPV
jgi:hypothetical protein